MWQMADEKMAQDEELKSMVMSFRVSELQLLLGFAGRNKSGRKTELQARVMELLHMRSTFVEMTIKKLYKKNNQTHTTGAAMQPSAFSRDIPSVHNSSELHQYKIRRNNVYNPGGYVTLPPPITDVKMKRLTFFDELEELIQPSLLVPQGSQSLQEGSFVFHLTAQQAEDIVTFRELRPDCKMEYKIQVQMRFCLIETSCEQEDCYPQGIAVKINGKVCPLRNPIPTNKPGVEQKRPPRPVNITHMIRLNPIVPNYVTVSWNVEYGKIYAISIYLVRKLSSSELLQRLKQRGVRPADYTRGLINENLQEDIDCEIATTSLRVSLLCPLGKMRMTTSCRALSCYHLQCFDAYLYLQMNERKPTWMCPVCDKPAIFDNLVIDGYFQQVLDSDKLKDCNEVQLHQDGSWSPLIIKKEQTQELSPADKSLVKVEQNDVFVREPKEHIIAEQLPPPPPAPKKEPMVIDLTFSESDGFESVGNEPC